ncbi:uncharacterized protein LOC141800597 [Halichoeres trimaculatus]|uniref:uncharacterized protein LOC141800597 n=1 Tax=Halichoeres trimaculatus TaxID=147232 RepID=UPI003D9EE11D
MDPLGKWFESECGIKRSFVCQGKVESGGHIFVAETKSWRDAQDYCRSSSSELVSIHSEEENEAVRNISVSQNVWIGLFKDPWEWCDGSKSTFRFWKPSQPNYFEGQNCVAAVLRNDGKWNDLKCEGRRDFICRGAMKVFTATTIKPSTQLSQTTSEVPTNLTSFPNTSHEFTIHFNVTSFNQSNTASATSEEATTVKAPIQNTTELTLSTLSTKLNNAATEMPNVTVEQVPSSTTVEATSSDVSTATTQTVTSAKTSTQKDSTTQLPTLKPTEDSLSWPPGNMILIKKNLTWTDAMTYCRRYHIDLVHITSKHIQEKVAEEVKNSTSPHVWLGLRYACNLNFWFWISSSTGCYQNWAPGQGLERKYDCDTTGAIEATGGQQWVGLSQTEELNFICSTCAG